jgi:hypothetical protein
MHFLGTSYRAFVSNYSQLRTLLEKFADPQIALELWAVTNRHKLDAFQQEVLRHLQNYLASAKSLVQHTRNLAEEMLGGTESSKKYDKLIKEGFTDSPVVQFVEDLRDYTLHNQLPLTSAVLHWERDKELDNSIMLEVGAMKAWKGWSTKGKEFIKSVGDQTKLADIVNSYASKVIDLHGWLSKEVAQVKAVALAELDQLQERLRDTGV